MVKKQTPDSIWPDFDTVTAADDEAALIPPEPWYMLVYGDEWAYQVPVWFVGSEVVTI